MQAKIIKKQVISKGVLLVELETLENVNFIPGQFFSLKLLELNYHDERGDSRFFGFTNTPGVSRIEMITKVGISAFKKTLQEAPLDTLVEVDKISGPSIIPEDLNKSIIILVDGIGIGPFMSVVRFIKEKHLQIKSVLFYMGKVKQDLPFISELENYAAESSQFKLVTTDLLSKELITKEIEGINEPLFFIRGEKEFVLPTLSLVKELAALNPKIAMEIFTGY